jgi:hypothetical protein
MYRSSSHACESTALLAAFGSPLPQPTEWQRIGNEINAAMVFVRSDFVNVRRLR